MQLVYFLFLPAFASAQDVFLSQHGDISLPWMQDTAGQCSTYDTGSGNCDNECGMCQNPGSRAGVMCKGSQTGYYCAPDSPAANEDMAFACMDWTFGSNAMKEQQTAFQKRTGEDVFFGVGTFGTADDVQQGLGSCFRVQVDGVAKDLLLQSINTGSDVSGNQFDLQIGDGGAGAFNTCAGGSTPGHNTMYPGPYSQSTWGNQYGGVDTKAQCKNLPKYPEVSGLMKQAGDDLITLCEYGFDRGVRGPSGENPSILSIGRVECPEELVYMTQVQRNDDPTGFSCGSECVQAHHECELNTGGTSQAWCLTRMMDCRKPSGGFIDNLKKGLMVEGHNIVQPCTSDGYTRIDVQCGCNDCYC